MAYDVVVVLKGPMTLRLAAFIGQELEAVNTERFGNGGFHLQLQVAQGRKDSWNHRLVPFPSFSLVQFSKVGDGP